jgi:hypothetical protein
MPGKPVRIGPFKDGLNNVSLSGESKDTELVELVNFEVGPDNLLWSRPPYEVAKNTVVDIAANWKVLGVYRSTTTLWYVIVSKPEAAGASKVLAYAMGDFTSVPILIKDVPSGNTVTAYVQMNADCYFCVSPSSSISSFKWVLGGATTDIAAMKKGNCMIAFKSRLWIAGIDTASQNSRLYFSAIGVGGPTPDIWNAVDYADIAPGEGGFITALLAMNSNIMIFKNDGTWRYSYPSTPSKGQVDKISGSVGAATATSVVEFENYVYVYDQGRLYELVSNTFTQLNRFVTFEKDAEGVDGITSGVDVSIMNRRIIVRYFNAIYAYSIDSRAWSQWRSYLGTPSRLYELPGDSSSTASNYFIAASAGTTTAVGMNKIPAFTTKLAAYLASTSGAVITAVGSTFTVLTPVETIVTLNDAKGYNLRVSPGQKWHLTGYITKLAGVLNARLTCLNRDGSTTLVNTLIDNAVVDKTITIPGEAIAAKLAIVHTGTATSYTMHSVQFNRTAVASPATIMSIKDEYSETPVTVEYIDCKMRTKSYDFEAPSVIKRMFWWGADIKTNQLVKAKLIPMAIKKPPTHGALRAYTHLQLQQGTWGNPLSFLSASLTIEDGGDPTNAVTENGRIFVKLIKSLRFKQLSFSLELSTLGTKASGPAKIHTITAYVMPKEKVVDKFN